MKRQALSAAVLALLLAGCSAPSDISKEATPTAMKTTAAAPTTEEAETVETTSEEPTTSEEELKDALSAPTEAPQVDPALNAEQQFLEAYKTELETLPEGPYAQLGTDAEAIQLGYRACDDLSIMSHAEALFAYAFSDATEEQVADYNAALNAAQFTLCP